MPEPFANVTSKYDSAVAPNPNQTTLDPWADFRLVERLTLELTQLYRHSLGKYSRFFLELENKRFLATKCSECGRTFAPPRPLCPECLTITQWIELPGTGTLETYSILHFSPGTNEDVRALETPYTLAYVLLDGATTLFPHLLQAPAEVVAPGFRVRVRYSNGPVYHPIHLMHFVPLEA